MDDLIKLVAEKANISESAAKTAVETVVNQLKQRLPAPIAAHIDTALSTAAGQLKDKDLSDLAGLAKGFFGK
jgi:uncharacterized protein (DUF2267 family)